MAKSKTEKNCFIIMPITTPEHLVERYKGDIDHFEHVLEHLFIPALNEAGFNPVSPKSTGSNVIHADIIKELSNCELVLCDMSILNPNVFYEFGIRTALDKPVALVVDNKTKPIPFDTTILNFHTYDSAVEVWSIDKEKQALTKHIQDAYKKSKGNNALWKIFGVAQTGLFKPEEVEMGEKIDLIMTRLNAIERQQKESAESVDWVISQGTTPYLSKTPDWAGEWYRPTRVFKTLEQISEEAKQSIGDSEKVKELLKEYNELLKKNKPQATDSENQAIDSDKD